MRYILFTFLLLISLALPETARADIASDVPIPEPPATTTSVAPAVSNVLFLPGIKGTRLYAGEEKLWEPSGKEDIQSLYLDADGRSIDLGVHARAGDILSEAWTNKFYKTFFEELNALAENDTYGESWTWLPGAYDWRLSLYGLVSRGARHGDRINYAEDASVPYIEQMLRDLAATSPTGKVTIIAHSNGGLVAKALMQKLGDIETQALIDKVIFVGVPQSGAPQALAAALFGYGEALPFDNCAEWLGARLLCGLLVDRPTARVFAEHSPMTYHLLPSGPYFERTRDKGFPPIRFSGATFYTKEQGQYGLGIDSAHELYEYALAQEGGRTKPAENDTENPNVLSPSLIEYARTVHAEIDSWQPPLGVEVHQVGGWGRNTMSGVYFYEAPGLLGLFGGEEPLYRPDFTDDGDGVVPIESALMMEDAETHWINLARTGGSHADLFEIPDVRTLIRDILTDKEDPIFLVSDPEPGMRPSHKVLFFLHSPLTLGLTDSSGRYTGLLSEGKVKEDVPDVEYGRLGNVQYLIAPRGTSYELHFHGLAKGTFTLEILEKVGNDTATTTSIVNVPMLQGTLGTFSFSETGLMSQLEVDLEGDGVVDMSVIPKPGEPVIYGPRMENEEPEVPTPIPPSTTTPSLPSDSSNRKNTGRTRSVPPLSFTNEVEASSTASSTTPEKTVERIAPSAPDEKIQEIALDKAEEKSFAATKKNFLPYVLFLLLALLLLFAAIRRQSNGKGRE